MGFCLWVARGRSAGSQPWWFSYMITCGSMHVLQLAVVLLPWLGNCGVTCGSFLITGDSMGCEMHLLGSGLGFFSGKRTCMGWESTKAKQRSNLCGVEIGFQDVMAASEARSNKSASLW